MLFIYSPVRRLVLNSSFGSLNGTKYFQCEHWYSLLVQVKSTFLSPYFHYQHLNLHWLYTWHWLVNAYYFKFYLQLFITQNIPAKKKMSSTPIGASTTWSTLWMRYKTKPRDIWWMTDIFSSWYLYKKHFPTTNRHWPVNHCGADMTVCHLPALRFHPVPLKLSNPDQTTSL